MGDSETKRKKFYGLIKLNPCFLTITLNATFSQPNTGHHLIISIMIYGGASIMMWGGFSAAQPGRLVKIYRVKRMQQNTLKSGRENHLETEACSPARHQPLHRDDLNNLETEPKLQSYLEFVTLMLLGPIQLDTT